ncbi:MAG: hypothetical protein ABI878_05650 [Acidobacteriota bacterium]
MKSFNLKKIASVIALSLISIFCTSEAAFAQGNRGGQKQDRKADKHQDKADRERARAEQQRQTEWTRRNTRIINTRNTRTVGGTYYNVQPTVTVTSGRYRIYRNGRYYNTDNRGADMLRQAVNEGYRQGFAAGRSDRHGRRNSSWSNNNVYRTGTYGYSSGVDRSQYQYYFQQGFQRGYQDGSNSQYRDDFVGNYQYGYNEGGTLNVLGTILNEVLNIQTY